MVITLIGYRGSGKSSVARLLAAKLNLTWIDSDDVIEERSGRSIHDIFSEDGEPEFRRLEHTVIRELTSQDSLVIAAGGGAILAEENRMAMRAAGPVVWLQASVANLAKRIQNDDATVDRRPSLTGQAVADEVEAVLRSRHSLYADAATMTVNTDGLTLEQVAEEIVQQLPPEGLTA
jgi:shikimate kinase